MNQRHQVFKCVQCGNIVEILHGGAAPLVCCGEEMKLFKENTVDAAKEKHIPVSEKTASGYRVKVGDVAHPMEEKHYIEWIEIVSGDKLVRQYLKPGQQPQAEFELKNSGTGTIVREYCNLHGLWKGDIK